MMECVAAVALIIVGIATPFWVGRYIRGDHLPPQTYVLIGQCWMVRGVGEVTIVSMKGNAGTDLPYRIGYEWQHGDVREFAEGPTAAFLASATLITELPGEQ